MKLKSGYDPITLLLVVLLFKVAILALNDKVDLSQPWVDYTIALMILGLSLVFTGSACGVAISQARSYRRKLDGAASTVFSLRRRIRVYLLVFAPAVFAVILLSCMVWSWFRHSFSTEAFLAFFLLLFGPPRIRSRLEPRIVSGKM